MNQPTAIIVKDGYGNPVGDDRIIMHHPCPSIANTEPGKTVLAELKWQYKPYDDKCFFTNCSDDLWELKVPKAFKTRQIWVPIVEQKEGEGKAKADLVESALIHEIPLISKVTGISTEWLTVWYEVEMFYGDIQKKETREQLLLRLQKKYNLTLSLSPHHQ